ncbi:hypothetical protein C8Q77DRAFT_1076018 [Trametes polyzona]|nr:hypothetical protein C8Q77DRAFT_1076018 [Trametes polyzona]
MSISESDYRCPICKGGISDHPQFPESPLRYYEGEVFQTKTRLLRLSLAARKRSEQSLQSLMSKEKPTNKEPRPCILTNDIYDSQEGSKRPYVCLMATFDGTPIEEMPRIMGFFCIPVTPHDFLSPDRIHLHSLPEWPVSNGWIIAYAYTATRPLVGRWRAPPTREDNKGRKGRKGMVFGALAMKQLRHTCKKKHTAWKDMCSRDTVLASEYEREYRKRSGSCKSGESGAYHHKKAHQRMPSRSVLSHTLFEDKVVDFYAKPTIPAYAEVHPPRYEAPQRARKPSKSDKRSIVSAASSRISQSQKIISNIGRRFTHVRKGSKGDV